MSIYIIINKLIKSTNIITAEQIQDICSQ